MDVVRETLGDADPRRLRRLSDDDIGRLVRVLLGYYSQWEPPSASGLRASVFGTRALSPLLCYATSVVRLDPLSQWTLRAESYLDKVNDWHDASSLSHEMVELGEQLAPIEELVRNGLVVLVPKSLHLLRMLSAIYERRIWSDLDRLQNFYDHIREHAASPRHWTLKAADDLARDLYVLELRLHGAELETLDSDWHRLALEAAIGYQGTRDIDGKTWHAFRKDDEAWSWLYHDVVGELHRTELAQATWVPVNESQRVFMRDQLVKAQQDLSKVDVDFQVMAALGRCDVPMLSGLSPSTLIRVRRDEPAFAAWQAFLRQTIRTVESSADIASDGSAAVELYAGRARSCRGRDSVVGFGIRAAARCE